MDMLLKIVKVEFFIVVEIDSKYYLIKIKEIKIQQLYHWSTRRRGERGWYKKEKSIFEEIQILGNNDGKLPILVFTIS